MSHYSNHPRFTPPSTKSVVKPLPRSRRRFLFLGLILVFIVAVPASVFYATGYRYDFLSDEPTITATGGLYISVGHDKGEVYLNNVLVEDQRSFRNASYIQNLSAGLQRVHIQVPGYQVWVKELPVYAHIVTEASAFVFPDRPQLRPITEFVTSTGTSVYFGLEASSTIASYASTTVPLLFSTNTKATSTFTLNSEYEFVKSLFATTTASTTTTIITRVVDEAREIFQAGQESSTSVATNTEATSTAIVQNNTKLFKKEDEVFVRFNGPEQNIPYYFCIPEDIGSTSARYAAQYKEARLSLLREQTSTTSDLIETTTSAERLCRREIRIDRQWQNVKSFAFYPGSTDLIIMHRDDGVYVTEVDDRAWQNSQKIYPNTATNVKVEGGRIFVQDGKNYFEILPTLISEQ